MLLEDFNYFLNKAVNQYVNKRYNIYDINQQTSDDIRVLKSEAKMIPKKVAEVSDFIQGNLAEGATYEVFLPLDYLHILNCVCYYKVKERFKCYDAGTVVKFKATRLTSDLWSNIINDYYNRPLPQRPYFYIHNKNTVVDEKGTGTNVTYANMPTNPIDATKALATDTVGTDTKQNYTVTGTAANPTITSNLPRTVTLTGVQNGSLIEKEAGVRYGNPTSVRCEIRYGEDDTLFELIGVKIDYIKAPQFIRLTQEQVNLTRDTSQPMEFTDNVCQEIINELVNLVMENTADPRLATHAQVT